jgi:hypothetical protein
MDLFPSSQLCSFTAALQDTDTSTRTAWFFHQEDSHFISFTTTFVLYIEGVPHARSSLAYHFLPPFTTFYHFRPKAHTFHSHTSYDSLF